MFFFRRNKTTTTTQENINTDISTKPGTIAPCSEEIETPIKAEGEEKTKLSINLEKLIKEAAEEVREELETEGKQAGNMEKKQPDKVQATTPREALEETEVELQLGESVVSEMEHLPSGCTHEHHHHEHIKSPIVQIPQVYEENHSSTSELLDTPESPVSRRTPSMEELESAEQLMCHCCQEYIQYNLECSECNTFFCRHCIAERTDELRRAGNRTAMTCPQCHIQHPKLVHNTVVQELMNATIISCSECEATIKFGDLGYHLRYKCRTACRMAKFGCSFVGTQARKRAHEKSCKYCRVESTLSAYHESLHESQKKAEENYEMGYQHLLEAQRLRRKLEQVTRERDAAREELADSQSDLGHMKKIVTNSADVIQSLISNGTFDPEFFSTLRFDLARSTDGGQSLVYTTSSCVQTDATYADEDEDEEYDEELQQYDEYELDESMMLVLSQSNSQASSAASTTDLDAATPHDIQTEDEHISPPSYNSLNLGGNFYY